MFTTKSTPIKCFSGNAVIPNKLFMIWFGSMLPETKQHPYQSNIKNWAHLNPDYAVSLLTDSQSMDEKSFQELISFCKLENVKLLNINDKVFKNFPNREIMEFELGLEKWARASDIGRITLLSLFGGVYVDIDLRPFAPLGELVAPLGTLQFFYDENISKEQNLQIYFMAATPDHPLFQACVELFRFNHLKFIENSSSIFFMTTKDPQLNEYVTLALTGGILNSLFQQFYSSAEIQQTYYDIQHILKIYCDSSWRKHGDVIKLEERRLFVDFYVGHEKKLRQYESKILSYYKSLQSTSNSFSSPKPH